MKRSKIVIAVTTLLIAANMNFANAASANLTAKQTATVKAYFAANGLGCPQETLLLYY